MCKHIKRDQICGKGYGFCLLPKKWLKSDKCNQKRLYNAQKAAIDVLKNSLLQMHLKLPQKEQYKKQQNQLVRK